MRRLKSSLKLYGYDGSCRKILVWLKCVDFLRNYQLLKVIIVTWNCYYQLVNYLLLALWTCLLSIKKDQQVITTCLSGVLLPDHPQKMKLALCNASTATNNSNHWFHTCSLMKLSCRGREKKRQKNKLFATAEDVLIFCTQLEKGKSFFPKKEREALIGKVFFFLFLLALCFVHYMRLWIIEGFMRSTFSIFQLICLK